MRTYRHTLLSHSFVFLAVIFGLLSCGPQIFGVAGEPIAPDTPSGTTIPRDSIGNQNAAADVYGLGVRLGFYLQGFTQLLHLIPLRKDSGRGVKLACASIAISILASWSVLAGDKLISPCETFLVTFILNSVTLPATFAVFNPDAIVGEGIGSILFILTVVWTNVATTWTYAKLWHTLPLLHTENVVFFFAPVSVTGWFRKLGLVLALLSWLSILAEIPHFIMIGETALRCYFKGISDLPDEDRKRLKGYGRMNVLILFMPLLKRLERRSELGPGPELPTGSPPERGMNLKTLMGLPVAMLFVPIVIFGWALLIVMAEKTISLNNLSPSTDLSAPGQLIPLITGLSVALDSIFFVCRPPGGKGRSVEQFTANVNKIRQIQRKLDNLHSLSRPFGDRIRMDNDVDNVIRMLWPKITFDLHNVEGVLHEYDILAEHSKDISWCRRIQKSLRKMTWKQDRVQGYLDRLTSNVSELETTIISWVRGENLMREIPNAY